MKKVKVSKICTISNGFAFKSEMYVDEGARIIRITNVQKGHIVDNDAKFYPLEKITTLDNYKIFEEDILMSLTGNVGRVGLFPKELLPAYINQRVCRVKSNNENELTNRYLFHYFNSNVFENKAIQNSVGATQLNLSTTWLGNLEIPLPPLPQQKAIAEQLDKAQELIQYNEQLIEKYDELQQSLFLDMFGDPVLNEKGWEMGILNEHTSKIGSGATPRGGSKSYKTSGISLVRSMNVYNARFEYKNLAFINDKQAELLNNVELKENDILINITGASVARSCIVPKDVLPARVNQHVSIIRTTDAINPIFLNSLFISEVYQRNLLKIANINNSTREAITKVQLELLEFILPPLSLQNEFASHIESIELQKEQAKEALAKSKDIFQGLLQEHFSN